MHVQFAVVVLWLAAGYLFWFAAVAFFRPALASKFLLAFAADRRLHLLEMAARLLVAGSCWLLSQELANTQVFLQAIAAVVGGSSLVLLCLPWRWHRQFALYTVPKALRYLPWLGASALLMALTIVGWLSDGVMM